MKILQLFLILGVFGGPFSLICDSKLFQILNLTWFLVVLYLWCI